MVSPAATAVGILAATNAAFVTDDQSAHTVLQDWLRELRHSEARMVLEEVVVLFYAFAEQADVNLQLWLQALGLALAEVQEGVDS